MNISVLGLNHRTAPIELREQVAFQSEETLQALAQLRRENAISEIAILSTCNRTEFYTVSEDPERALAAQVELIRSAKGIDLDGHESTYLHRQRECVEHLFGVAGGIDSMVVGEPEILGQVKDAYELATHGEAAGVVFGKLFPSAFRVGKRSRSETAIGQGAVSLGKAGIQLAGKIFGDLERRSILVIGAGTIAQGVAHLLHDRAPTKLAFANRTVERAEQLASQYGGRVVDLADVPTALRETDVLVTAVSSPEPIVHGADIYPAIEGRRGPLLVIDLGVPRNVEAQTGRLGRLFLYAVDDLQELVNLNLGRRRREIPAVQTIVAKETARFFGWLTALSTKPIVKELRGEADRVRLEAIANLGSLSPDERKLVEKFSMGFMNKMLHSPTVSLRACDPATYRGLARIDWTRRLFGLDDLANGDEPEPDA
jgi:glutamyl-tRNA reductase